MTRPSDDAHSQRIQSLGIRACDAYRRISSSAARVMDALDDEDTEVEPIERLINKRRAQSR